MAVAGCVCVAMMAVATPGKFTKKTYIETKKGYWTATVVYPEFPSISPVAKLANKSLAQAPKELIKDVLANWKEMEAAPGELSKPANPFSSEWNPDVSILKPNLISVAFIGYEFSGGAHPNDFFATYSYGLVAGKPKKLTLDDLFKKGVDPVKALSPLVIAKLKKLHASSVVNGSITSMSRDLLKNFVLTPTAIAMLEAPDEVASHAEGAFTAKVKYTELKGKLDPNGPLAELLKPKT